MIERFYLKNNLSFKEVDLNLKKGLIVFTGSSGSGKSLLIDSILACFSLKNSNAELLELDINAKLKLESFGIQEDNLLIFKRIYKEKIRFFINNQSVSKTSINSISKNFVKHLSLKNYEEFNPENIINLLDEFIKKDNKNYKCLLDNYQSIYKEYRVKNKEFAKLKEEEKKIEDLKEFIRFELERIDEIAPKQGEYEDLLNLKKDLSKKDKIKEAISRANDIFIYEKNVSEALNLMSKDSSFFDDCMNELRNSFEERSLKLDEMDEEDVGKVLDRVEKLSFLIKKYQSIENALEYREERYKQLQKYENIEIEKLSLEKNIKNLEKELSSLSQELSSFREEAIKKIKVKLDDYLKKLFLRESNFTLSKKEFSILGVDEINIGLINTKLSDLSSGEFNRLRLALLSLKTEVEKDFKGILFLDEIDANLSGEEAMSVAKVLKALSKNYQIFAISHQPQLSSLSKQHFLVSKDEFSFVRELKTKEERILEIARMVSGEEINAKAKEFAKTMIEGNYDE